MRLWAPPTTISATDVKRVIETGLAPLIAKSVGVEPTDELTTAISKTVATYDYNTRRSQSDEEQNWTNENAESLVQRYQLDKTLNDAQRIQLTLPSVKLSKAKTNCPFSTFQFSLQTANKQP